jgi:hypothetical protein
VGVFFPAPQAITCEEASNARYILEVKLALGGGGEGKILADSLAGLAFAGHSLSRIHVDGHRKEAAEGRETIWRL